MTAPLASTTLPQNTGSGYVAAAYIVFVAIVLIYVTIMAIRLTRVERGLRELNARAERPPRGETRDGARPEETRQHAARQGETHDQAREREAV
jgi:hypothetical protein